MSDIDLDLGDTRLILAHCTRYDLLRNQAAYVLATAFWETARTMEPVSEAFWVTDAEAWRRRNLRYYPHYGRGYVQLTWEGNYRFAGKQLDVDLLTYPHLALKPEYAARILVEGCRDGWFTRKDLANGWTSGHRLEDFITLQQSNFVDARRIVNGTDKADTIAAIAVNYDAALLAEGYGVEGAENTPSAKDLLAAYINHKDVVPGSPQHTIAGALRDL